MEFKRIDIGRDSFGVRHYFYSAVGLPDGVSCRYLPEEADRPRGEWFVATLNGKRKRTIRCKSEAEAVKKAAAWCRLAVASVSKARHAGLAHANPAADKVKYLSGTARKTPRTKKR